MVRRGMLLSWLVLFVPSFGAFAQTTSGSSATIVVPVIAQTASFGSEVTAYNPNGGAITVNVSFYDAQNTANPGAKACTPLSIGAGASVEFSLAGQCALPTGANFGLLVMAEATGTQRFYGYARTQNPQGIGFSTEGFPIENFNDQLQHATGLKRVAASGGLPAYQTNCFVASLGDAVNYQLQLYDGGTGNPIGSTLSGSLQPWQQYRYLDVFSAVGAPSGDLTDVRAQFTNLTGTNKKLIGFCTVQDNTSFSADFRIAKSYGGTPQNAFVQGGNAFSTTALLGTVDNQPLDILANGQPVARYLPTVDLGSNFSVNVVAGHPNNGINPTYYGQTIAGGGEAGTDCYDPSASTYTRSCANQTQSQFGTIGGGFANVAGSVLQADTVAGGESNTATGGFSTVGGGYGNIASNYTSTVAGGTYGWAYGNAGFVGGGSLNLASGDYSVVSGGNGSSASGLASTVGGGYFNAAGGNHSTIAGGQNNSAAGDSSMVPGGASNHANGTASFAAGTLSTAGSAGEFVWADNQQFAFDPAAPGGLGGWSNPTNTFNVRATGGTWFVSAINGTTGGPSNGVVLYPGAGAWSTYSDRNGKENLAAIDPAAVLLKVVGLPIATWNWKSEAVRIRHMGPMAQDFYAAFGLGADSKHIVTVDEEGVALAAIQGLNQQERQDRARFQRMLQEKDSKIEAQQREIDAQQAELEAVKEQLAQVKSLRADLTALKGALLQQGSARLAMQATP